MKAVRKRTLQKRKQSPQTKTRKPRSSSAVAGLPSYLRRFIVEQDYEKYTPRDHAVWRFIMRNSSLYFKEHAHGIYLQGLRKTGIPVDRIPDVREMDHVLSRFGWGAVCVCGFIPPLAFLEFQAHRVLPIATDMRSYQHIAYTPAPDIVHEAAGHAPIIADRGYRRYLEKYAQIARKAIFSSEDIKLYEAIRILSDTKESSDATPDDVARAEQNLLTAGKSMTFVSEAARVARLYWWTAEYGMIGSLTNPKIYGAGLLSSMGESRSCFASKVRKLPLDQRCLAQGYDITEPQPQLYVAPDFKALITMLEALEATMSFRIGGRHGLETAKQAQTVTTTVLDTGIEVSGQLDAIRGAGEEVAFLKWKGPVQLAVAGRQIRGHGTRRHGEGFGMPVGPFTHAVAGTPFTARDCKKGAQLTIRNGAGIEINGRVKGSVKAKGRIAIVTLTSCSVLHDHEVLFDPAWGEFDLALSQHFPSVYGGPADLEAYGEYNLGRASTQPARTTPFTRDEKRLFGLYGKVRALRGAKKLKPEDEKTLRKISKEAVTHFDSEWLLGIEIVELGQRLGREPVTPPWLQDVRTTILAEHKYPDETRAFISMGLELAEKNDLRTD